MESYSGIDNDYEGTGMTFSNERQQEVMELGIEDATSSLYTAPLVPAGTGVGRRKPAFGGKAVVVVKQPVAIPKAEKIARVAVVPKKLQQGVEEHINTSSSIGISKATDTDEKRNKHGEFNKTGNAHDKEIVRKPVNDDYLEVGNFVNVSTNIRDEPQAEEVSRIIELAETIQNFMIDENISVTAKGGKFKVDMTAVVKTLLKNRVEIFGSNYDITSLLSEGKISGVEQFKQFLLNLGDYGIEFNETIQGSVEAASMLKLVPEGRKSLHKTAHHNTLDYTESVENEDPEDFLLNFKRAGIRNEKVCLKNGTIAGYDEGFHVYEPTETLMVPAIDMYTQHQWGDDMEYMQGNRVFIKPMDASDLAKVNHVKPKAFEYDEVTMTVASSIASDEVFGDIEDTVKATIHSNSSNARFIKRWNVLMDNAEDVQKRAGYEDSINFACLINNMPYSHDYRDSKDILFNDLDTFGSSAFSTNVVDYCYSNRPKDDSLERYITFPKSYIGYLNYTHTDGDKFPKMSLGINNAARGWVSTKLKQSVTKATDTAFAWSTIKAIYHHIADEPTKYSNMQSVGDCYRKMRAALPELSLYEGLCRHQVIKRKQEPLDKSKPGRLFFLTATAAHSVFHLIDGYSKRCKFDLANIKDLSGVSPVDGQYSEIMGSYLQHAYIKDSSKATKSTLFSDNLFVAEDIYASLDVNKCDSAHDWRNTWSLYKAFINMAIEDKALRMTYMMLGYAMFVECRAKVNLYAHEKGSLVSMTSSMMASGWRLTKFCNHIYVSCVQYLMANKGYKYFVPGQIATFTPDFEKVCNTVGIQFSVPSFIDPGTADLTTGSILPFDLLGWDGVCIGPGPLGSLIPIIKPVLAKARALKALTHNKVQESDKTDKALLAKYETNAEEIESIDKCIVLALKMVKYKGLYEIAFCNYSRNYAMFFTNLVQTLLPALNGLFKKLLINKQKPLELALKLRGLDTTTVNHILGSFKGWDIRWDQFGSFIVGDTPMYHELIMGTKFKFADAAYFSKLHGSRLAMVTDGLGKFVNIINRYQYQEFDKVRAVYLANNSSPEILDAYAHSASRHVKQGVLTLTGLDIDLTSIDTETAAKERIRKATINWFIVRKNDKRTPGMTNTFRLFVAYARNMFLDSQLALLVKTMDTVCEMLESGIHSNTFIREVTNSTVIGQAYKSHILKLAAAWHEDAVQVVQTHMNQTSGDSKLKAYPKGSISEELESMQVHYISVKSPRTYHFSTRYDFALNNLSTKSWLNYPASSMLTNFFMLAWELTMGIMATTAPKYNVTIRDKTTIVSQAPLFQKLFVMLDNHPISAAMILKSDFRAVSINSGDDRQGTIGSDLYDSLLDVFGETEERTSINRPYVDSVTAYQMQTKQLYMDTEKLDTLVPVEEFKLNGRVSEGLLYTAFSKIPSEIRYQLVTLAEVTKQGVAAIVRRRCLESIFSQPTTYKLEPLNTLIRNLNTRTLTKKIVDERYDKFIQHSGGLADAFRSMATQIANMGLYTDPLYVTTQEDRNDGLDAFDEYVPDEDDGELAPITIKKADLDHTEALRRGTFVNTVPNVPKMTEIEQETKKVVEAMKSKFKVEYMGAKKRKIAPSSSIQPVSRSDAALNAIINKTTKITNVLVDTTLVTRSVVKPVVLSPSQVEAQVHKNMLAKLDEEKLSGAVIVAKKGPAISVKVDKFDQKMNVLRRTIAKNKAMTTVLTLPTEAIGSYETLYTLDDTLVDLYNVPVVLGDAECAFCQMYRKITGLSGDHGNSTSQEIANHKVVPPDKLPASKHTQLSDYLFATLSSCVVPTLTIKKPDFRISYRSKTSGNVIKLPFVLVMKAKHGIYKPVHIMLDFSYSLFDRSLLVDNVLELNVPILQSGSDMSLQEALKYKIHDVRSRSWRFTLKYIAELEEDEDYLWEELQLIAAKEKHTAELMACVQRFL